jgi:hypothetical protein
MRCLQMDLARAVPEARRIPPQVQNVSPRTMRVIEAVKQAVVRKLAENIIEDRNHKFRFWAGLITAEYASARPGIATQCMLAVGLERISEGKKAEIKGPLAEVIGAPALRERLKNDTVLAAALRDNQAEVLVCIERPDPYAVRLSVLLKPA